MNKGFTLVELLAVLVIMAIVFSLTVVNIVKVLDESAIEQYNLSSIMVEDAAREYIISITPTELNIVGGTYCVTLQVLYDRGLIDLPLKNPMTNESFPNYTCVYVERMVSGNYYEFNRSL